VDYEVRNREKLSFLLDILMKMYVNSRRKQLDSDRLKSITITLPQSVIIEMSNHGITSGRGIGNMSYFIEVCVLIVIGLFSNPEMAKENLIRLIKYNPETRGQIKILAESVNNTADRLKALAE